MICVMFLITRFEMCCTTEENISEEQSLASVVKSQFFVDKTLLIREFFKYKTSNRILVTAPRRFGKTLNMNLIKAFCEAVVDENGDLADREETGNYGIFADNNLTVFRDSAFFEEHFGKYPVIHLNFGVLNYSSYDVFMSGFKSMVANEFRSRRFLLKNSVLTKRDSVKREMYYEKPIADLQEIDLRNSMLFLSKLLFGHFNRTKCIILIDEYDTPVREAILDSGSDLELILEFIRSFNAAMLKTNANVDRALINCCMTMGDVITPKDTGVRYVTFMEDAMFLNYYGFLKEEVKILLKKIRKLHMFDDIKKWFGGFSVQMGNIRVFNSFSILQFLKFKTIGRYWAKSIAIEGLEDVFLQKEVKKKMEKLLDTTVEIKATHKMKIRHVSKLKQIVNMTRSSNRSEICERDADLFIKYMTDLGYFNVVYNGNKVTILDIPNLELNYEIDYIISYVSYFEDKYCNCSTTNYSLAI